MKRIAFGLMVVAISLMVFQQMAFPEIYCKIKGRVIDAETREGIPNVYVNAHLSRHDNPKEYYVFTDEKGYFTFSNLIPGLYKLSYDPLFPYVAFPDNEYFRLRYDDSFMIDKGEIKQIQQELQIGGEIILNYKLVKGNFSEYEIENYYLDRIEGNELKLNIQTVSHRFNNPRFKPSSSGFRRSGLAPGEYIICRSLRKRPENYSGDDVDYAGVIKRFSLDKRESKELDIDYNSTAKIIFDIKDKDGNKFNSGDIQVYRRLDLNGEKVYYSVWNYSYDAKDFLIKPIIIEPGDYLIEVQPGDLIDLEGKIIDYKFKSNWSFINIAPDENKKLTVFVSVVGTDMAGIEDFRVIH